METPQKHAQKRDDDQPGYAEREDEATTEQTGGGVRTQDDDDRWATDDGD